MSLAPGVRLGAYQVTSLLGSGGMGEVYRAHDGRLGRDVAVKVLPAAVAGDEERLRRFELEARAAGALNHPNVLAIHELGRHDGVPFVVAELLEGETLRTRLQQGPLSPARAVDLALQVARGLAAAHERGIVHRDLKPDNLFVTRDGHIKILDFGLAKLEPELAGTGLDGAPTMTRGTTPGSVLGTVGYMAPEQVRGRPADHRADIFSLGAILYEMLSGRRAFRGDSAVETLNAILKDDPAELSASGRLVPPALERLVRHCLEKRPEDRFQSARDLVFDLEALSGLAGSDSAVALAAPLRARRSGWRRLLTWGGLLLGGALLFLAGQDAGHGPAERSLLDYRQATFRRGVLGAARFAPDGGTLLYSAAWDGQRGDVYVGRLDAPDARSLGLSGAVLMGVSTAGEMLVLQLQPGGTQLGRVSLSGGAVRPIAENVAWADWSRDGSELVLVPLGAQGRIEWPAGTQRAEAQGRVSYPRLSPDGRRLAFFEHPFFGDDRGSVALVDRDGERTLLSGGWASLQGLAWSPDGREVWFTGARSGARSELFAVSLGGRVRRLANAPGRLVLHDVAPDGRVLVAQDAVRSDVVALAPGAAEERVLSWHDLSTATDLSADGSTILFSESGEAGGSRYGVYLRRTDGSPAVRLGEGRSFGLSPDGRWALTAPLDAEAAQLVLLPTGAGQPRTLGIEPLERCQWATWYPDGKRLLLLGNEPDRPLRMFALDLEGGPAQPVTPEGLGVATDTISPDGRTLVAQRFGAGESFLVPLQDGGGEPRPLPAVKRGELPLRWSADGRSLFVAADGGPPPRDVILLDPVTGRRTPWRQIKPLDPAGIQGLGGLLPTPDGRAYVYNARRTLSSLFLVEGLN